MDSDRWHRIKSIVDDAKRIAADRRRPLVEERCAGDESMLLAVETLLRAHEETAGLTRETATALPPSQQPTKPYEPTGPDLPPETRIDDYIIRRKIGEGSFGVVYSAEQTAPVRRKVALKIVKAALDARQILARFDAERQALALMNHDNIAKIYGAGTATGGRPYFVMEYVPGVRITEHCDRQRLGIEERLGLFVQVCRAVQHAHQKGIIHRDLKPSNILVAYTDGNAVPKVIDFGVAKALERPLTDRQLFTLHGQLVGTPAYMSPEQASGSQPDIDTRSDIYSLGVLLYELLIGALPFDPEMLRSIGYEEMLRVIRDVEPSKPSTKLSTDTASGSSASFEVADRRGLKPQSLTRLLRGDLDWITMRCLEKDRSRRYAAASDLAADLLRHLHHEPVEAGPPSIAYRARKFLRRNRAAVISATTIAAVVLAGIIVSTFLAVDRAHERRQRVVVQAELDKRQARELLEEARSVVYELHGAARELADRALALDPSLIEADVFRAYALLLEVGADAAIAAGREVTARNPDSAEAAVFLASLLRAENPQEADRIEASLAETLREDRLYYYRALGTTDDDAALELLEQSLQANPWYFDAKWQEALRYFALFRHEKMLEDARLLASVRPELARPWTLEGVALSSMDRLDEAAVSFDRAVDLLPDFWLGYYNRGWLQNKKGDYAAALLELERALELSPGQPDVLALIGANHVRNKRWKEALAPLDASIEKVPDPLKLRDRGNVHRHLGNQQQAVDDYTAALAHMSLTSESLRARIHDYRGVSLRHLERFEEAQADLERAIELAPEQARFHYNLGYVWLVQGRYEESLKQFERAVALEPNSGWAFGRGIANWFLGRDDEALRDLVPVATHENNESMYSWLWEIHLGRGDPDAAREALATAERQSNGPYTRAMAAFLRDELSADEFLAAVSGDEERVYAMFTIGSAARARGRREDARGWFTQAIEVGQHDRLEHDLAALRLAELAEDSP